MFKLFKGGIMNAFTEWNSRMKISSIACDIEKAKNLLDA